LPARHPLEMKDDWNGMERIERIEKERETIGIPVARG
jgi:hypothetical protein